jgi:DNA-binding transcriptional MerR regulator
VTPKLFKAAEVCELTGLQPYVLRSWEKEFPGIGVQKSQDSARLYRQSDVDQVLRIKELVFAEGLTLSGARRRIEDSRPVSAQSAKAEAAEVLDALGADARTRIANVRDGLQSILSLLSGQGDRAFELRGVAAQTSRAASPAKVRAMTSRAKPSLAAKRHVAAKRSAKRGAKRKRASA